jgi:hypothetical protein
MKHIQKPKGSALAYLTTLSASREPNIRMIRGQRVSTDVAGSGRGLTFTCEQKEEIMKNVHSVYWCPDLDSNENRRARIHVTRGNAWPEWSGSKEGGREIDGRQGGSLHFVSREAQYIGAAQKHRTLNCNRILFCGVHRRCATGSHVFPVSVPCKQ